MCRTDPYSPLDRQRKRFNHHIFLKKLYRPQSVAGGCRERGDEDSVRLSGGASSWPCRYNLKPISYMMGAQRLSDQPEFFHISFRNSLARYEVVNGGCLHFM